MKKRDLEKQIKKLDSRVQEMQFSIDTLQSLCEAMYTDMVDAYRISTHPAPEPVRSDPTRDSLLKLMRQDWENKQKHPIRLVKDED